jgi:hypothetical protein
MVSETPTGRARTLLTAHPLDLEGICKVVVVVAKSGTTT